MKKEIDDLFSYNNIIYMLYTKLAKLEIEGKLYSNEYYDIIQMIKNYSKKFDQILHNRKIWNNEIINIIDLINTKCEFENDYNFSYVYEVLENNKLNIKRILQHIFELELELGINISDPIEEYSDSYEEYDDEFLNYNENSKEYKIDDELESEYSKLEYIKITLEIQMFMAYLLDQINITKNKTIKKELIKIKYRMISLFRNLELSFLNNPKEPTNIEYYQMLLDNLIKNNPKLGGDYLLSLRYITHEIQVSYIDRDKTKYKNIKDKINDILNIIKLKSLTSLSFSDEIRNEIIENAIIAEEMATQKINKDIFIKSSKINKKHVLPIKKNRKK